MRLDHRITKLAMLSVVQKKSEWRRLAGKPVPPAFGAGLLTRAIAYAMQENELGGLDKGVARRIDQLASKADGTRASKAPASVKPGTWLSRTWHGEVHQVVVLESGFEYRGERYSSLSAIARHITGTGWSGPRFFGLHSPRLGKLGTTSDG